MNKNTIHKNRLDLAYHRQLQILHAILILGTTGILSFIATFIWKPELMLRGLSLTVAILILCLLAYLSVDNKLRNISRELNGLAS